MPLGQFGTRAAGGANSAAARYLFTRLSPVAKLLFPPADMPVLPRNLSDDGAPIEPSHFVPVLPVLLLNGSSGIGTGWMTLVHAYHPIEVLDNVAAHLEGRAMAPLLPWSPGFKGTVAPGEVGPGGELLQVVSRGVAEAVKDGVVVRELPLGMWTDDYKEWLVTQQEQARCFAPSLRCSRTRTRTPCFRSSTRRYPLLIAPCLRPRQGKASWSSFLDKSSSTSACFHLRLTEAKLRRLTRKRAPPLEEQLSLVRRHLRCHLRSHLRRCNLPAPAPPSYPPRCAPPRCATCTASTRRRA